MEKKKTNTVTKSTTKKTVAAKKTATKRTTAKKKKSKKGFTLIELLAVIIILGILMIVAIPSVTTYISNSRKSSYATTAQNIVSGARTIVNSGKLGTYDRNTTYYIPYDMVNTENGTSTPYGDFDEAYVVATYEGDGYEYYFTGVDTSKMGLYLTYYNDINSERIISDLNGIDTSISICGKDNIIVFDKNGSIKEQKEGYECVEPRGKYIPEEFDECKYKIVTNYGSFSLTEDVKESCIETIADDYKFNYKDIDLVSQYDTSIPYVPTTAMSYFYTYEGPSYLKPNSYIKIYEDSTKQNLIKTITAEYFNYKYRFSLSAYNYTDHYEYNFIVVPLGVYNFKNIYAEFSDDFPKSYCNSDYSNNNDYHRCVNNHSYTIFHDTYDRKVTLTDKSVEGPWIKSRNAYNVMDILYQTLEEEANRRNQDFRIHPTVNGNTIYFNVEFYTVIVE